MKTLTGAVCIFAVAAIGGCSTSDSTAVMLFDSEVESAKEAVEQHEFTSAVVEVINKEVVVHGGTYSHKATLVMSASQPCQYKPNRESAGLMGFYGNLDAIMDFELSLDYGLSGGEWLLLSGTITQTDMILLGPSKSVVLKFARCPEYNTIDKRQEPIAINASEFPDVFDGPNYSLSIFDRDFLLNEAKDRFKPTKAGTP